MGSKKYPGCWHQAEIACLLRWKAACNLNSSETSVLGGFLGAPAANLPSTYYNYTLSWMGKFWAGKKSPKCILVAMPLEGCGPKDDRQPPTPWSSTLSFTFSSLFTPSSCLFSSFSSSRKVGSGGMERLRIALHNRLQKMWFLNGSVPCWRFMLRWTTQQLSREKSNWIIPSTALWHVPEMTRVTGRHRAQHRHQQCHHLQDAAKKARSHYHRS